MRIGRRMFIPGTWFVYLLECADSTLYCGVTNNLARRLEQHNRGQASKCTAARLPVRLLRAAAFPDKRAAMRAEYRVKKTARERKQETLLRLSATAAELQRQGCVPDGYSAF